MADERAATGEFKLVDYRELMKKVEQAVATIERAPEAGQTVLTVAETIIHKFRDELGITGGRLYRRRGAVYVLETTLGDAKPVPPGFELPASYPSVAAVIEEGAVYMKPDDPRLDRQLEQLLGSERFAAIEVGSQEYILSFDVTPGVHRDYVVFSLGILRHSINQKLRQQRMEGVFRQAREIQTSLLPRRVPVYDSFDLAGKSVPMETVGGDFYDYIPLTDKILGLAIADASGHGLPAALQVRDIYMGLRMGLARDFKIVRTVERMNQIIHKSTLTSRFVSLFYGELELSGVFIYVNAGHPPPFHLAADGTVRELTEGGAVLGPIADAAYERGFVRLAPGDMLVLYTDGIVETTGGKGRREEFGTARLQDVARGCRERSAADTVACIFEAVTAWSAGRAAKDDRTVVVVRYPAGPAAGTT
ncbi:MAG TPA: PP2C family protein-serine/threonine phosphatase [Thermoanaerobaculia bacterium]|nr:PP2C family protein-serine/threonine phosphatase [Thermoanaerobaculia bacterium]